MQRDRTGRGTATAHARHAHFPIDDESWRRVLPRRFVLVLVLLALMASSAATAQTGTVADGVHAEQVAAAARFGIAQVDNANARLRSLHRGHDGCDRFEIGANIRWERVSSAGATGPAATGGPNLADAFKRSTCDGGLALWAGGSLDLGILRPSSTIDRSDFRTSGLTLGADMKMLDGAIIGAAIGYGRHDADIDAAGSETRAHGQNVMLYGTFEPIGAFDIDAMVGFGGLSFDLRRLPATESEVRSADRGGAQFFGSVAVSAELVAPRVRVAPYARYDHVRSRIDGHAEPALAQGRMCVTEDALALGIYAGITLSLASATVEPGLRVEQRLRESVDSDGSLAASLILPVRFGSAASVAFEYSYASSSDAVRNESVRALLQTPF